MATQRTAKLGEPELDRPETADCAAADSPSVAGGEESELFAAAGPFEQFPGAVLLAGRDRRVLGANGAARALADRLIAGTARDLEEAIAAAADGKAALINPFLPAPEEPGGEAAQGYDLVALPWISGDTALVIARDITLERSLRAALIESRQRYKDLVEVSSDFAWETDGEGRFTFVSPRGAVGYAAGQLVGQRADEILLEAGGQEASPFAARGPFERVEIWVRTAAGGSACLSAVAVPLMGPGGEWRGARGVCREITHERERAAELTRARHREALLGYILRIVRDELEPASMLKAAAGALVPALAARGVAIFRRQGEHRLTRVAQSGRLPAAAKIKPLLEGVLAGEDEVGASLDEGHLLIKATHYRHQANGALCLWREDDGLGNDEENRMLLAEIAAQIAVANEQLAREQQLEKRSASDGLTGLLNRGGFLETLTRRFSRAADRDQPGALFYIDLENFKAVNELRGHEAGDRVLADLGALLRQQIRRGDLAARFDGDEFVLFLAGLDGDAARRKAASLLGAAKVLRTHSASKDRPLGFSIGVALYDPAALEAVEELIARAERAMYAAKRAGERCVSMAEPAADGLHTRITVESEGLPPLPKTRTNAGSAQSPGIRGACGRPE